MNKKDLNKTGICDMYISPEIRGAGWTDAGHIRREFGFTNGRLIPMRLRRVSGGRQDMDTSPPLRVRLTERFRF